MEHAAVALASVAIPSPMHLLMLIVIVAMIVLRVRGRSARRRQDFQWYRTHYPHLVRLNGVACHACGGTHVVMRHVPDDTDVSVHVCNRCGTALYHSFH